MMRAYDKVYLNAARRVLARMLDYAVNGLGCDADAFMQMFLSCGLAEAFEHGDFRYIAGKSGIEVANLVLERSGKTVPENAAQLSMDRSPEYWCGWALAYYQWKTAVSYRAILQKVPIHDMIAMYMPYHEMDIEQFVDEINRRIRSTDAVTNLKTLRTAAKLSQSELASLSNIPIKTIQKYESRETDINHANGSTLYRLSKALGCSMEDLLEDVV